MKKLSDSKGKIYVDRQIIAFEFRGDTLDDVIDYCQAEKAWIIKKWATEKEPIIKIKRCWDNVELLVLSLETDEEYEIRQSKLVEQAEAKKERLPNKQLRASEPALYKEKRELELLAFLKAKYEK